MLLFHFPLTNKQRTLTHTSSVPTAHAPLLKFVALATFGVSVVALASGTTDALAFDARSALTSAQHLTRAAAVLAGPALLACVRAVSLFLALALLYRVRAVERFLGSAKLAVLAALTLAVHALLCIAAAALYAHRTRSATAAGTTTTPASTTGASVLVSSGPVCFVTAVLVLHRRLVPALHHARVCGVRVSEKALDVALWLNLVAAEWPHSALGVAAGLAAGWLFAADVGRIAQRRLPRALTAACAALFLPFLDPHTPAPFMTRDGLLNIGRAPVRTNEGDGQQGQQQGQQQPVGAADIEAFRAAAAAAGDIFAASDLPPGAQARAPADDGDDGGEDRDDDDDGAFGVALVEPDPEAVGLLLSVVFAEFCFLSSLCFFFFFSFFRGTGVLVAMGIDESVARDTLAACDNNVSIAANRILDASS